MTRFPTLRSGVPRPRLGRARSVNRPMFAAVGVMAALGAAACGSSATATPSTSRSTTTTSIPPAALKGPTVTIDGKAYPVPTEFGTTPIDPTSDTGQQIIITSKGFLPYHLFADLNTPIVWTNLSSKPVRISFEYSAVRSPEIPPGGTFTYSSKDVYSFVYRSSTGYRGSVDIGAFQS